MATLNLKLPIRALQEAASPRETRAAFCVAQEVTQEVTQLLAEALEPPKPHSILDLKGLGKEHWRGVDAAEHVEKERASWDRSI